MNSWQIDDNDCEIETILATTVPLNLYKVMSVFILDNMQPILEEQLPNSQARFREARGFRNNVLILKTIINEKVEANQEAVITFIDYTATCDSISHGFLDESLAEANIQPRGSLLLCDGSGQNAIRCGL